MGNISKLLWPPDRDADVDLRAALRASLEIGDDSVLAPRTFRNHFEHFDKRLEAWAKSSERHNLVDSSIMPTGAIVGLDPGDYLRNLDPTTLTVTFRGDEYALKPIVEAVSALFGKAKAYEMPPMVPPPSMG